MHIFIFSLLFLYHLAAFAKSESSVEKAIDHAVARYGLKTEPDLKKRFEQKKVDYPPKDIALLTFKKERQLQLWAKTNEKDWKHIHTYPLTAFSGHLGPKLKERDRQIPEGVYKLLHLNPYSDFHLSMKINYPNQFDKAHARKDGRTKLGNNIFLHGKELSVGCLAIGDKAIDQLFLLVRRVGLNHVQLVIAPNDLRRSKPATPKVNQPQWLPELYQEIDSALSRFPV